MNPIRFKMLARRHAVTVKITKKEFTAEGWNLTLECGHSGKCVAHHNPGHDWQCAACGEKVVKNSPLYAKEFS